MKLILVVLCVFLVFMHGYGQAAPCENLVFEGAGIRGIAYAGVLSEMERAGLVKDIARIGGTSAGAITALLVSLGYTSEEIYRIISDTKFQKFNDGGFFLLGGLHRLTRRYGWYKGHSFSRWLGRLIGAKAGSPDITFRQLAEGGFKRLYVTGTCLNRQQLLVFSPETYPDMKVKDAVRISMSVPLYFEAVFIDSAGAVHKSNRRNPALDVVVDGGITGNFPIFVFDSIAVDSARNQVRIPNPKTLGVRVDTDVQITHDSTDRRLAPMPVAGLASYLAAFYTLVLENLNRNPLTAEDWLRTISVSSAGIGPRIRRLDSYQKRALMQSGERHAAEFLRKRN